MRYVFRQLNAVADADDVHILAGTGQQSVSYVAADHIGGEVQLGSHPFDDVENFPFLRLYIKNQ